MASRIRTVFAGKLDTDEEIFQKIERTLDEPYGQYLFRGVLYKNEIASLLLQDGVAFNFPDEVDLSFPERNETDIFLDAMTYDDVRESFQPTQQMNFMQDYVGVDGYVCVYDKNKFVPSALGEYGYKFIGEEITDSLLHVFQVKSK